MNIRKEVCIGRLKLEAEEGWRKCKTPNEKEDFVTEIFHVSCCMGEESSAVDQRSLSGMRGRAGGNDA